ncbi:MAG: hypothetical protein IJ439_05060 [Tyzzerella sp.]|nr:hypothetical protein [Tyzzerella sp.]
MEEGRLDTKQWKHKITSGITGVILSAIMLAGFGALALWMHKTQNGAIVIGRIVVIFAALAFVLALYRALFFKVLIGKEGFFYQSNPANGKYYSYCEIKEAWISSGRETNTNEMNYCNFETNAGKVTRFFYTGADMDAVQYFLKRVEKVQAIPLEQYVDEKEYTISGKVQGAQKIGITLFILGILLLLVNPLVREGLSIASFILPILFAFVAIIYVIIQYYFYRIHIEENGFFCQTNPFDGKYYKYNDIVKCEILEIRKRTGSVHRAGSRRTYYLHFFVFQDISGKKKKIMFDKALFEHEMNVLKSRIEQAQQEREC